MMTMAAIHSLAYYSDLTNEDYYLDGGEPTGEWAGKGAVLLGLSGMVDDDEYKNIMQGYSPSGREKLCLNPGEKHRSGWDLCFSAPKSVSVAWARSDEKLKDKIQHAQKQAVLAALSLLEKQAAYTRLGRNGLKREHVIGLLAALFEHCTSRTQDPQLHTHCLVANVAPRANGSWGTIESRDLFFWQKAAGATYRAELAANLRELGFIIEKDEQAFKIKGVHLSICEHYAKRASAIKEELKKRGNARSASKVGDIVAFNTRTQKGDIDRKQLYQQWHNELNELGFTPAHLDKLLKPNELLNNIDWLDTTQDIPLILETELIKEHLTEHLSVFRKQDAFRVASEMAQWSGDKAKAAQQVAIELLVDTSTIALGEDSKHNQLFTTKEIIEAEQQMIATAKKLRTLGGYELSECTVSHSLAIKDFQLSEEQKEAVITVCQGHRFSVLQGSAGSGKSASQDCVREAYENEGFKVIGAAIAKSAANNLSQEANITTYTVAKLLSDIERNKSPFNDKTVILVDEAGQIGTKQLAELISAAADSGSKLVLLGDSRQLDALQHGGSLRYLSQPEVLGATRIKTIRRQRQQWARQAVADFRDGKANLALSEYNKRNFLHSLEDAETAKHCLVACWDSFRKNNPEKKSLILAQRWKDVAKLNAKVRTLLQNEGEISKEEWDIDCCVSDRHIKYKIAAGERIKFTKNDYRKGFTNGDLGTVQTIDKLANGEISFQVKLDSGRCVTVRSSEYCNEQGYVYFTQAYALTVYSSQGLTVEGDVFLYYTTGMDRAHTYVACSRHKDNCHIFVNKKELAELASPALYNQPQNQILLDTLATQMSANNRKRLAIEYLEKQEANLLVERIPEKSK